MSSDDEDCKLETEKVKEGLRRNTTLDIEKKPFRRSSKDLRAINESIFEIENDDENPGSKPGKPKPKMRRFWSWNNRKKKVNIGELVAQPLRIENLEENGEIILNTSQLNASDIKTDTSDSNSGTDEESQGFTEFPVVTAKGYYSDSEICIMKKPNINK